MFCVILKPSVVSKEKQTAVSPKPHQNQIAPAKSFFLFEIPEVAAQRQIVSWITTLATI